VVFINPGIMEESQPLVLGLGLLSIEPLEINPGG